MQKLKLSWPNRITIARILLIVPFMILMLHINDPWYKTWARYAALSVFVIMALSDALDGYLARRTHSITSLGTFLDPLADKLLITCSCLLLSLGPVPHGGMRLPSGIVVIIIGKDIYTVIGFIIIYMVTSEVKIVPVRAGKLCTALQLTMVIAILLAPDMLPHWPDYQYLVRILYNATAAMAALTALIYTRNGARYISEYEQKQQSNISGK